MNALSETASGKSHPGQSAGGRIRSCAFSWSSKLRLPMLRQIRSRNAVLEFRETWMETGS